MGRKRGQKNKKPETEEKQHEDKSEEKKKETPSSSSSRDVPSMVSQVTEPKHMDMRPSTSSGRITVVPMSKVEIRHKQTEEQKYAYGEQQHKDRSTLQEKKTETPFPSSSRDVPPMVSQVTEQKPTDMRPSTSSGSVIVASTLKVEMRHKQTEEQKYAYGKQQFTTQSHKKQIYKKGPSGQQYQFPSTSTKYQPQVKQVDSASGIPPAEVLKMPYQKRHTPTSRDEKSYETAGSIKGATQHQSNVNVGDSSKKVPLQTPTQQSVAEQGKGFELSIPQRKAQCGTKGRPIQIETNHLPLIIRKFDTLVHYDVTIIPDTPKKLLRKVMEEFRMVNYKNRYPAFDGTKNLYSSTELPFGQHITGDVTVCHGENPKSYKVTIKFAKFLDPSPLKQFMTANSDKIRNIIISQEIIQCLDVVLRSAPALTCLPVGRNYFTPPREHIFHLGDGMEMYRGFYQSAIIGWKPFLNIDVAHKAFPASQNMIDLILEMCDLRPNDLQKTLDMRQVNTVDRFIRTLKVRYEIPGNPSSKREYRVNGLEKSARAATFKPENGPEMTVESYFHEQRNVNLRYPHMPCLWVGKIDRVPKILLPAEFCTIMEGQVINRKLPEKVTSNLIRKTATSTKERKDKIMGAVHKVRFNDNPCVREFGINVSEEFLKINGRVLVPPNLKYNKTFVKPAQGSWRPDRFLTGASLTDWTIVNLDRYVRREALERMAEMMCSQAPKLGMHVAEPQRPYQTLQLRYNKELQDLQELFKKKKDLQLLIVVVPNNGPFYSFVKQAAELAESGIGCLTQCIRSLTVSRINVSTIINILQKINAKLQGINHVLNDPVDCMNLPYIIMGADVTHPGAFSKDKPSVAAVTASCDLSAFRYNICWRLQPPRVEIIEDLEAITREQLLYFYNNTGQKPVRIIFFRDGVSEGQFSYVLNTELQAIRRACSGLNVDYKPEITFLVVQKRHHTRFFPVNPQDASRDKNLNVPVGTCVDTEITHPTDLDFYLLSHASIQGVARPTKYRVLWDDADMNHDDLQELAFCLCHMFSRCTRSVSYPAPTYYAHLAAARIIAYCETRKLNIKNLAREQERLRIQENIIKGQPMFFV